MKSQMSNIARHIVFSGRVQGVGFRFTALNIASQCGLTGYVRNLPDGTVEMLTQGQQQSIDDCVRDIRDSFPGCIRDVVMTDVAVSNQYKDFRITF
jgi:acylphosphatase